VRIQGCYTTGLIVRGSNLNFVIVEGDESDFFTEKTKVLHSWAES
jgi:hypothetical protein